MSAIDVSKEDQERINKFSRLNVQHQELKEQQRQRQTELEYLKDSLNETELLELNGEEQTLYKMGDVFVRVPIEEAKARIEAALREAEEELRAVRESSEQASAQMLSLKKILYAKFNDAINLEFE